MRLQQEQPGAMAPRHKASFSLLPQWLCVLAPLREAFLTDATTLRIVCERVLSMSLALAFACCLSCNSDHSDRVRVEHKSAGKTPEVFNDGELAGRVVFAVSGQGVPASGANIMLVNTDAGKLLLEHLRQETDPSCIKRLTGMETFVLESAQATARAGEKLPTATADDDGYFLLPRVKPGAYLAIAYGRAGDTQAIWEQPVMVEQFQAVTVKMVEPLLACSGTGDSEAPSRPPPLPPPTAAPAPPQP
jgi:hypothetical protein